MVWYGVVWYCSLGYGMGLKVASTRWSVQKGVWWCPLDQFHQWRLERPKAASIHVAQHFEGFWDAMQHYNAVQQWIVIKAARDAAWQGALWGGQGCHQSSPLSQLLPNLRRTVVRESGMQWGHKCIHGKLYTLHNKHCMHTAKRRLHNTHCNPFESPLQPEHQSTLNTRGKL